MNTSCISDICESVAKTGHTLVTDVSHDESAALIKGLGNVLWVTDVTVKLGSRPLVTSDKALDFHTDHHKADLICWHCLEQADEGGETILLDAYELLRNLTSEQLYHLRELNLFEHKIFTDDPEYFPFLSARFGRAKVYYSFWLLKDNVTNEQKTAFNTFRRLTEEFEPIRYKLKPNDLLVIDNGRMLHGRTAIGGNKKRLLKRYWIETNQPTKGE